MNPFPEDERKHDGVQSVTGSREHEHDSAESIPEKVMTGNKLLYRRRRRERGWSNRSVRPRPRRYGNRGGGSGRHDARELRERLIIASCFVLALAVAGFFGFVAGKNAPLRVSKSSDAAGGEVSEVFPTADSEALLDEAFGEMSTRNYGKALIDFQKVKDLQSPLSGVDFLVGKAAFLAGEQVLAEAALQSSISKKEMVEESRVLLALVDFRKSGPSGSSVERMADPSSNVENAFRRYASLHHGDPGVYDQWADFLRSRGSYRSAADMLRKGSLRAEASASLSYLSAKETLTELQNEPSKEVPSLAVITSMSGEKALGAAYTALQHQQTSEALLFIERAREFYPKSLFKELLRDPAFDEFRTDPKLWSVFGDL